MPTSVHRITEVTAFHLHRVPSIKRPRIEFPSVAAVGAPLAAPLEKALAVGRSVLANPAQRRAYPNAHAGAHVRPAPT